MSIINWIYNLVFPERLYEIGLKIAIRNGKEVIESKLILVRIKAHSTSDAVSQSKEYVRNRITSESIFTKRIEDKYYVEMILKVKLPHTVIKTDHVTYMYRLGQGSNYGDQLARSHIRINGSYKIRVAHVDIKD